MNELGYLFSVLLALAAYAVAGVLLWVAVESVYYLWCKATGREY
jgi:fucose permease